MSIKFPTAEHTALKWQALACADNDTVKGAIQQDNNTQVEAVAAYLFNQISFTKLNQVIRERTDQIELLTNLLGKINSVDSSTIDWSNDLAMKHLIEEARKLGVAIPEGKYTFTSEERESLKDNIRTKKDELEKMTQDDRATLQKNGKEIEEYHQTQIKALMAKKQAYGIAMTLLSAKA